MIISRKECYRYKSKVTKEVAQRRTKVLEIGHGAPAEKHNCATSDQHVPRPLMWHSVTTMLRVDHSPVVLLKWHGQPVLGGTTMPPCSTYVTSNFLRDALRIIWAVFPLDTSSEAFFRFTSVFLTLIFCIEFATWKIDLYLLDD